MSMWPPIPMPSTTIPFVLRGFAGRIAVYYAANPDPALAGFRWGYIETDIPGQAPSLLTLEVTGPAEWNAHLPFLAQEYSRWTFRPA